MRSFLLLTAVASLVLSACSPRQGYTRSASPDASSDGSQTTRAYSQAPATQAPSISSKPLSETNTPDAVAARQAQSGGKPAPGLVYRPPAATVRGEPAAPHAQIGGFEKGSKARVRAGAALRSRPSSGSDAIESLVLDEQATLDTRVYNAEGYWWYVLTGTEDGWLSQADLLQP